MKLADLPTPSLVLDRQIMMRNIRTMAGNLARHKVPLRPHMKTAKSIDIARLALAGQPGGITVSTLAEAEYFASHGVVDILYAVGVTPVKLDQVARLNACRRQRDGDHRRSADRRRDHGASGRHQGADRDRLRRAARRRAGRRGPDFGARRPGWAPILSE